MTRIHGVHVSLVIPWRPGPGRDHRALDFVTGMYRTALGIELEVIVADDAGTPFNRGRALNAGVAQSRGEVLVLADADLVVPLDAIDSAVWTAAAVGYVVPFTEVAFLDEDLTADVLNGDATAPDAAEAAADVFARRSTGGCNVITRDHFDAVGGFDPRFAGWGFEDAAFDTAVSTLVGPGYWPPESVRAVHLWHPTARDPETPEHQQSLALCRRYEQAHGDRRAVETLIAERCW